MLYFYGLLNCAITNACNWTGQVGPERANKPIIFEHFAIGMINNEIRVFSFHIRCNGPDERRQRLCQFFFIGAPDSCYNTFNFHYLSEQFNKLSDLNEFNALLAEKKNSTSYCRLHPEQTRLLDLLVKG